VPWAATLEIVGEAAATAESAATKAVAAAVAARSGADSTTAHETASAAADRGPVAVAAPRPSAVSLADGNQPPRRSTRSCHFIFVGDDVMASSFVDLLSPPSVLFSLTLFIFVVGTEFVDGMIEMVSTIGHSPSDPKQTNEKPAYW